MNETEVVKLFLKNGYQISREALPLVLKNPEKILLELKKLKPRPFIVTEKNIKEIVKKPKKLELKVLREYVINKKPLTVYDYVKFFLFHYTKIKDIILKHMDPKNLVSINKIVSQRKFSVIGIVREKGKNNITIEDPTGEIVVFFEGLIKPKFDEISLDDIIGLNCRRKGGKYYAESIIYPDILSSREINRSEIETKVALLKNFSTLNEKEKQVLISILRKENISFLFVFDEKKIKDLSEFSSVFVTPNSNPTIYGVNSIKILVLSNNFFNQTTFKNSISFIVSLLKRRCLFSTFSSKTPLIGDFTLDEVPDLVFSDIGQGYKNYKGTTIVANTEPTKFFLVNLKTREVEERDLKTYIK